METRYVIGVDIGGSHVCCAVVDLHQMSIVENSITHRDIDNSSSASQILSAWQQTIVECISKTNVAPESVGFAFPGPFDYENGISKIEGVSKFEGIFGLDVKQSMIDRLRVNGIKNLKFVNDASAFALGECAGGSAKGIKNVVVLTLGTGFGSGFVSDGKLVTEGERVPANGWVYCLPFEDAIADDAFSTRWFRKRYLELTGQQVAGAKEIAERVAEDPDAKRIFDEYGQRLAKFIVPVASKFGAEAVVLGGNISRAFPVFEPELMKTLKALGSGLKVKPSTLKDKAAMIGAASLFI